MTDNFSEGIRRFTADVKRKVESIPSRISFPDLFHPDFMQKYSNFPTIEAFFEASGFDVNSEEDFKAIPDEAWENHVCAHTTFKSWAEMQRTAAEEYLQQKLK